MSLSPKISLSLNKKCDKINFFENTGVYVSTNNTGGWGSPNTNTDNILEAYVKIYDLNNVLLETYIIKNYGLAIDNYENAIDSFIPSPFMILQNQEWSHSDGIYKVVYSAFDGTYTYTNDSQYELFLCKICNCKQKLICKMVKSQCNIIQRNRFKDIVDQMEMFVYAIQCAFSCGNYEQAISILNDATTYCTTVSECNCGCEDC